MAADQLTAFLHLQRLTEYASKPEFTSTGLEEMTQDDLILYLQLENYMESIKASRAQIDSFLQTDEWRTKRGTIDTKIKSIEGALVHRRKLYAAYLMEQQNRAQERKIRFESLSKPIDLNQVSQLVGSRSVSGEQLASPGSGSSPAVSPPKSIVQATTLPSVSERDELIGGIRKRFSKPEKTMREGDQPAFHATHDALASDLVMLAKNLKQNNLAFQDLLSQDRNAVKETELLLNTNSAKFSREHEGLKSFRSTSWRSTKTTILMMFLLFAVFIFMYLLIKVTSK